jgi:hypothetical protein
MNINKKIEDILSSLDGSQRALAPDFFYTRLKARMEKGLIPQRSRVLRPAYVLGLLILILGINAAVLLKGEEASNVADTETSQSIAAEYSLNDNNVLYDLNTEK